MSNGSIINYEKLWEKIKVYSKKAGRASTRPLLILYYVMKSPQTPKADKLIIFSSIAYLVFPIDFISANRLPIIGWIDEVVALSVTVQKMSKHITPEVESKVDEILDRWFEETVSYEIVE